AGGLSRLPQRLPRGSAPATSNLRRSATSACGPAHRSSSARSRSRRSRRPARQSLPPKIGPPPCATIISVFHRLQFGPWPGARTPYVIAIELLDDRAPADLQVARGAALVPVDLAQLGFQHQRLVLPDDRLQVAVGNDAGHTRRFFPFLIAAELRRQVT